MFCRGGGLLSRSDRSRPVPDEIQDLPKIDLHHHLDGAIRTETIVDLAREHDVELPSYDVSELKNEVTVPPRGGSLTEFLDCFETFYPVLQYPRAVERVAYEVCEDLAAQNVLYAETRFAPLLLTEEGASQPEIVEAVLSGLEQGNREYDLRVNLLLCLYRGHSFEENRRTLECAEQHRDGRVVGIDLAGDESQHGKVEHPDLFQRAQNRGLHVTVHAGEAGPAENVREALDVGAERIGHGIRSREDPQLLDRLERESVPLEVCVTSNLQTDAVSSVDDHPIRMFYDRGLSVTVNTDDPAVSQTNINDEFRTLSETFNFTTEECRELLLNAVDGAFVEESRKQTLRRILKADEKGESES